MELFTDLLVIVGTLLAVFPTPNIVGNIALGRGFSAANVKMLTVGVTMIIAGVVL